MFSNKTIGSKRSSRDQKEETAECNFVADLKQNTTRFGFSEFSRRRKNPKDRRHEAKRKSDVSNANLEFCSSVIISFRHIVHVMSEV